MTQKKHPAKTETDSADAAVPFTVTPPHAPEVTTAPEVPREIAHQYGVHDEPLHAVPNDESTDGIAEAETASAPTDKPVVENPETDAAVDDIVSKESDQLLGLQNDAEKHEPAPRSFGAKMKHFFRRWWRNKKARYITVGVVVAGFAAASILPASRYAVLNTLGVRSSASVIILDDTTQLALKNVNVSLNGKAAQTNREGVAIIKDLKLGKYKLQVRRLAFAPYQQDVTIGWGSNPLGKVQLKAVGIQYRLEVKDYFSGKPIKDAEVQSDELNALSDDKGNVTLTTEDTATSKMTLAVQLSAPGYRPESLELNAATQQSQKVLLVPSPKTVFVSRETGKYDVYSADLDGKNKKLLLAGTGLENENIGLVVSPDGHQAALVSTRDNMRDSDGYLLSALTLINIQEGTHSTVDHAQQIQLVDWIGNRLIYRSTIAGASAADPQRNRLLAYIFSTNARVQLAAANQFNVVLSADNYMYYSASSTDARASLGLYRVKPDGSGRERLSNQEVWTGLRTDIASLSLQTPDGWYSFDLSSKKFARAGAPSVFKTYIFAANPAGSAMAWADTRDGKGVLLVKTTKSDAVKTVVSQPGLTYPVRWINNELLLYRVVTGNESADYVISPDNPAPHKILDITATHGYVQAS